MVTAQDVVARESSKPLVSVSGINSRIDKESYFLVKSIKDWTDLWSRHSSDDAERIPVVDFEECMIVAAFSGKMPNCRGLEAVELDENSRQIVLRFHDLTYQTVAITKDGGEAKRVTPYAFFFVRKSPKSVVLEKDVRQYLGTPPVWKGVASFPNHRGH